MCTPNSIVVSDTRVLILFADAFIGIHEEEIPKLVYTLFCCKPVYGRVLRYFERVSVAALFLIVAKIDSIFLFVASCRKLFVACCSLEFF